MSLNKVQDSCTAAHRHRQRRIHKPQIVHFLVLLGALHIAKSYLAVAQRITAAVCSCFHPLGMAKSLPSK